MTRSEMARRVGRAAHPASHPARLRAASTLVAAVTALTTILAGCSDGSTAGPGGTPEGTGTVTPHPTSTPTSGPPAGSPPPTTATSSPQVAVRKPLRRSCSLLDRRAAEDLLGSAPDRRSPDVRQWPPGESQLDGCLYVAPGGRSLRYVAWATRTPSTTAATPPPAPGNVAAARFDPGLGPGSSGVVITVGGWSTAEVAAQRDGRRVAVTATAGTAADARRIAVGAARALLRAR